AEVRAMSIPHYKDAVVLNAGPTLVERGDDFIHLKIGAAPAHEVAWRNENFWIFGAQNKISGVGISDLTPEQIGELRRMAEENPDNGD
ncbi:MAG: hypothetical protein RLT05_26845, partial [Bauldia litoralis]